MARRARQFVARTRQAFILITLCLVCARPAGAQRTDYDIVIGEAVAEYKAGHWQEALSLFERAHRLYPNARTLRGRGMMAFELRDYVQATRLLQRALEDPRLPLTSELKQKTQELLERAQGFIGRYAIVLQPADTKLSVDGKPAAFEADGALLLNLGEHTLRATANGYREVARELDVRGGEQEQMRFTLEVEPAPVAPPDSPAAPLADERPSLMPSIISFAVGAAGLATFAILGGLTLYKNAELAKNCSPYCSESDVSEAKIFALVADIGLAVGLSGTILGTVLLITRGSERAQVARFFITPSLAPSAVSLCTRGTF